MDKNFKLAVIGNESSVLIFRALGVDIFPVLSSDEAEDLLQKIAFGRSDWKQEAPPPSSESQEIEYAEKKEKLGLGGSVSSDTDLDYAIVFVEENYYKDLSAEIIERLTKRPLPAVIPISSPDSKDKNFSVKRLSRIVERAVGSDILG